MPTSPIKGIAIAVQRSTINRPRRNLVRLADTMKLIIPKIGEVGVVFLRVWVFDDDGRGSAGHH